MVGRSMPLSLVVSGDEGVVKGHSKMTYQVKLPSCDSAEHPESLATPK
jgi:hypothetical protein